MNIRNYNSKAAYIAAMAGNPLQSTMSFDGAEALLDGVNVIVPFTYSNCGMCDMLVYDTIDHEHKLLKARTYNAETFDSDRYIMSRGLYFGTEGKRCCFVALENAGSRIWAEKCYFRLTGFDLTVDGSMTFNTYYSWNAHNDNSVTWTAGATLQTVANSMKDGLSTSYFNAVPLADGTGIGVWVNYPTTGTISDIFSITSQSGSVEVEYMNKYNGNDVVWQYINISTIIEGRKPSISSIIRRNGTSHSYAGLHLERFISYYEGVNGEQEYKGEGTIKPMCRAAFNALAESENATQVELYDKYNGSYEEYMRAACVLVNTARGIIGQQDVDNVGQTRLLAEIFTLDYNRNSIPAFPAAYYASKYGVSSGIETGYEPGQWGLPSTIQITKLIPQVGFTASQKTEFNILFDKFNSAGNIYSNMSFWLCAEYSAYSAFGYFGTYGSLISSHKYNSLGVRGVLALEPKF